MLLLNMTRTIKTERNIGEKLRQFLNHRITQSKLIDFITNKTTLTIEQEQDPFSDILNKQVIDEILMLEPHLNHSEEYQASLHRLKNWLPYLLGYKDYEHSFSIKGHISQHVSDKKILDLAEKLDSLSSKESIEKVNLLPENHPYNILLNEAIRLRKDIVERENRTIIGYNNYEEVKKDLELSYKTIIDEIKGNKGFTITIIYSKEGDVKYRRPL